MSSVQASVEGVLSVINNDTRGGFWKKFLLLPSQNLPSIK